MNIDLDSIKHNQKLIDVFSYEEFTTDDLFILSELKESEELVSSIQWLFATNNIFSHIGVKDNIIYGITAGILLENLEVTLENFPFELLKLNYIGEDKTRFDLDCKNYLHIQEYKNNLLYYISFCLNNSIPLNHEYIKWICN